MSDHHTDDMPLADETSRQAGYEKSDVNLLVISILAIACILLVAAFAVGLNEYFLMTKESLYMEQIGSKRSPEVLELEAEQDDLLTTYGVVDQEQGIYRIPVERAMNLMLEEASAN